MKLVVYFAVLLLAPMVFLRINNGEVVHTPMMVASSLGLALLLFALWGLPAGRRAALAGAATAVLALVAVIVRLLLAFLYDFSGRGFGSELFIHANVTSLLVAWDHYGSKIVALLVLAGVLIYLGVRLARSQSRWPRSRAAVVLALGAVLFAAGAPSAPEWLLARAWYRYAHTGDDPAPVGGTQRDAALRILAPIRATTALPVSSFLVEAKTPERPLNLVLVYLESFNEMLTDHERYPGLTPRINELKSRLNTYSPVYSSAYLTIEGIANSQCGTLMNMEHANNSLITREGRLPLLPCLGDVLRAAGYYQVYLGGANLDFAGKGPFLREHGYDRTVGWEHWEARGFESVAHWGISDSVLFEQALETIERLRAGPKPFNLTLLTLGTHLPGFTYEGCPPYPGGDGDPFLDAVHCTDHLFGGFVDELQRRGVLEDTVLFAQADHGVFENPNMRELFGDGVDDKRLVTLVSVPPMRTPPGPSPADDASVNTGATILDLLGIEHNTTFLLGRSRFAPVDGPRYYLSRRLDYFRGEVIENDPTACKDETSTAGVPTLPLGDCDKRRVLDAMGTLNSGYVSTGDFVNTNQVCRLAVQVAISPETGRVTIKWGNEHLTRWFYHRGTRHPDTSAPGVYAVLLGASDHVRRALFFGADNNYDLWRLDQLVKQDTHSGSLLLVANTGREAIPGDLRRLWPDVLDEARVVYGSVEDGVLAPAVAFRRAAGRYTFYPASCDGGARRP